ncbi:MAG: hypothetical protein Q7T55_15645 [Solirubrobacteraceae bacterium]|nr:hypothetical protein [Solirubrobacteraceae bacterium]
MKKVGGLTYTPLADYSGRVSIAFRDGLVAVAVGGPKVLQLLVSDDGRPPQEAQGAGPIPIWGRVHVGSNQAGTLVVTYPRCSTATLRTCDIYEWNSETHRERLLRLASKSGRADLEATEDRGNVLRVTSLTPDAVVDQEALLGQEDPAGSVTLQERRRSTHRLLDSGGYGVVMNVGKIGWLESRPSDPCGSVTARMRNQHTRRTMFSHKTFCDQEEGGEPVGVGIVAGQFMFGFTRTYEDASVFAHPIDTGPRRQRAASLRGSAVDFAPVTSDSGYVVDGFGCDGRWEGTVPRGRCHVDLVTGLNLR